jgi:hypothetical protein
MALLLALVFGSGQADDYAIGLLRQWIIAVDAHGAGESDAALATVTGWTYDDLELMRPYVEALVGAPLRNNRDRGRRRTSVSSTDLQEIAELAKRQVPRDVDRFRNERPCFTPMPRCSGHRPSSLLHPIDQINSRAGPASNASAASTSGVSTAASRASS